MYVAALAVRRSVSLEAQAQPPKCINSEAIIIAAETRACPNRDEGSTNRVASRLIIVDYIRKDSAPAQPISLRKDYERNSSDSGSGTTSAISNESNR